MTITTFPDLTSQLVADRVAAIGAGSGRGRAHWGVAAGRAALRRRLSITHHRSRHRRGLRPRVPSAGTPVPC